MAISTATSGRPPEEELDNIDREFLLLIVKGYSSSYSIWSHIKKEAEMKGGTMMVYKNVNRRILILWRTGYIDEIKHLGRTPHGRIDYKLTLKGFEQLIPHILNRDEIQNVIDYLNKSDIDKKNLGPLFSNEIERMVDSVDHLYAMAIATGQYEFLPGILEDFERIYSLRRDIEERLLDRKREALDKTLVDAEIETTKSLDQSVDKITEHKAQETVKSAPGRRKKKS